MAIAFVQGKISADGDATNSTTVAATSTSAVGANNLVVGHVIWDGGGGAQLSGIADDKGNTYTIIDTINDPNIEKYVSFYKEGITNGPVTVTATFTSSTSQRRISICEYSGCATSSALDGHAAQVQTGATTAANNLTSTAFTTTVAGDLIWGAFQSGASIPTAGTSPNVFTSRIASAGGETWKMMAEDFVQLSAGSVAATASISTADWSTSMGAAFKPAVVAAAAPVPPLITPVSRVVNKFKPWFRQRLFNFNIPAQINAYVMPADAGTLALSGQSAVVAASHVPLAAGQGTLTIAGQDASLRVARRTAGGLGTLTLSGQTAALRATRTVTAGQGTLTLNGQTAGLPHGYKMPAGQGTLTLAGQTAALRATRTMTAGQGTLTLSGQVAITRYGHTTIAGLGTLTLGGQTATLKRSYVAAAGLGTLTLAGSTVNLIYSGAGSKTLPAGVGVLTLSGQNVITRYSRRGIAGQGTLTLAGQVAIPRVAMPAGQGTLTLSGQTATLRYAHRMIAGTGTLTLSGQTAAMVRGRFLPASFGTLRLSGQAVGLRFAHKMVVTPGSIVLAGQPAALLYHARQVYVMPAGTGSLALSGNRANLVRTSQPGIFTFGRRVTIPNRW